MGYSKKELKMYIKYIKKALKMINKMYKWKWIPVTKPLIIKLDLEEKLKYYTMKLNEIKKG
ncbi:MAG: hypothetical protein K6E20_03765 [Acholeplasmatales bacterium]|nr:hypothetical protein [Acholeplasmatales bacterium]